MPCYSPLKGFVDKETGGITFKRSKTAGADMEVACGQCLGCRLDRSRMWAMRIVHEASLYDDNCFITLTYDDQHLPADGSLNKSHFQKFMKRLRKKFKDRRIRYYQSGEYGDQLDRPHYHACLFNLRFPDQELLQENEGHFLFTSQTLEDLWGYGFCTIAELTFESAAYVARYCMKKVTGQQAHDHYLRCDEYGVAYWIEPEYATMSRRPGIGKEWYDKFKDDLFPSDQTPILPNGGVVPGTPRYYEQMFKEEDPVNHDLVKKLREQFRQAHKEEYTPQRLYAKYKVKKAQIETLKRELE